MTDQEKQFFDDCQRELDGIKAKLKVADEVSERLTVLGQRLDTYRFHRTKGLNFEWPTPVGRDMQAAG